jgi:hypothetical protein
VVTFNDFLTENNTFRGDANEILLGLHIAGSWDSFVNSSETKKALKTRREAVDSDAYAEEERRAKNMAAETKVWMNNAGFASVKSVEWVGRGAARDDAADLILTMTDGKVLGVSAKSTHQGRDIVSRSVGLGTIDTALKTDLVGIRNRAEERFVKKHNLSVEPVRRKEDIRNRPLVRQDANEERNTILRNIRNKLLSKLTMMPQPKLKEFVSTTLMKSDTQSLRKIRLIQVTGHGAGNVTIVDTLKNDKKSAMKNGKLVLAKSGNDSITFQAGGINIARIRVKYGTVPLASPIEVSVDPWSVIGRKKDVG